MKGWIPNPERAPSAPADLGSPTSATTAVAKELQRRRPKAAPNSAVVRSEPGALESFVAYACRFPTAKNQPFDFERFPFQRGIYEVFGDPNIPEATAMKSVQVGMSELLVRLTLYFADIQGLTALYVFPAVKQMHDFSDTRVNPLREHSQYLRSRTKLAAGAWNKGLKRIGDGHCYYRGSESKNDLIAIDADLVVLDEYDSLHPPNIPEAERRISGSTLGLLRRVGVPSDPEYGIAKKYAQSDRRKWLVKCNRCKASWQELDFRKNVVWDDLEDGLSANQAVVCSRCRRPLDVLKGEWVAECSDRDRPGFHVHRLMVPSQSNLSKLIAASHDHSPLGVTNFMNNDLGLPHSETTAGLDRSAIAAAISVGQSYNNGTSLRMLPAYRGPNLVTAGIDVASVRALNVRISEHLDPLTDRRHRKRALWIGEVESFDQLPGLLDRYGVQFACIDHLPESRLSYGLAEMFPGRVYVCHYASNQADALSVDTETRKVSVQRVTAIDAMVDVIRAQRNLLPEDLPAAYVEHLVAVRRSAGKDEYDRRYVNWQSTRPDDYFHAEVFDLIATEVAKVRINVDHVKREELWVLDERLDFSRSRVNDPYSMDYSPGPGGWDDFHYSGGPKE